MIDSMFQDSIDKTLDDRIQRPIAPPPQLSSFSLWNTSKAPFTGVAAGGLESAAFGSDVLGAFGQVQAGYGLQADPSLLFDADERVKRVAAGDAARGRVESGEAFSTDTGTALRTQARNFMPDPQTSNVVEQTLFGIARFGTKAVGYSLAGGPVIGATLTGADEGMTESDRLRAAGVDLGTRTAVGAIAGLSAAAATALPIAGRTTAQTVGLVGAGGPGAFIAQQAASRAILENADYGKQADQYDPFDPVGLAVSTLVPAAFGAYAMRGQRLNPSTPPVTDPAAARELIDMGGNERKALRYNDPRIDAYAVTAAEREGVPPELMLALKNAGEKSNPTAVSPKGAAGVAQLMPENQRKYGVTDAADPVQSIDGMAKYLRDTLKQYDGNIQAVIADYNGGPKQARLVMEGKAPAAAETRAYLERVNRNMSERRAASMANDPDAVAAARVNLVRETVESWNLKDPADITAAQENLAAVLRASDQIGAGETVAISDLIPMTDLVRTRALDDMIGRLETVRSELLPEVQGMADAGAVTSMRDEISQLRASIPSMTDEAVRARAKQIQAEGGSYKQALTAAKKELQDRTNEINGRIDSLSQQIRRNAEASRADQQLRGVDTRIEQLRAERADIGAPTPKRSAVAVRQAVNEMGSAKSGTSAATKTAKSATETADSATLTGKSEASGGQSAATATLDNQAAQIAQTSPDMLVQLEGMEAPMRLAEALDAVRNEAARDIADAPLLQVAAECFLRNG